MLKSYLKVAFRNLLRYKVYTVINMSGLAIGLACCIIIFQYVRSQTGYDQYHQKKEQIYRLTLNVERLASGEIWTGATSSILWGPAMKRDYPEVIDFCRVMEDNETRTFRADDKQFSESKVVFADRSLFDFFTWPLVAGNSETALAEPNAMVLDAKTAHKYFGEQNALGKTIVVEANRRTNRGEEETHQLQFKVTGVMENIPYKTHLKPDIVISFKTLNDIFHADVTAGVAPDSWFWRGRIVHNYLMLQKEVPPQELEAKFPAFLDKYVGDATTSRGYQYHPYLQPVTGIHLEGDVQGTFEPGADKKQIYLFSLIAFFVLMIACINFMNLATARSTIRSREVGVRKVVGANRSRLVWQFLGESVLMSFVALLLAMLLVEFLTPIFYSYLGQEYHFADADLPIFISGIIGITLLVGLAAGSYPAFFLSTFQPVKVLKNEYRSGAKGSVFRKALVVLQFAITVFFIFGTLTVYRQLKFMENFDLGFKKSQVLVIPPEVTQPILSQIESYRNEFLNHPDIRSVTLSSAIPGRNLGGDIWGEKGKAGEEGISMDEFAVDYDFIDLYGLEIVAGRNFVQEMTTDAATPNLDSSGYEIAAIINEAAVRRYGWSSNEEALGKRLVRDPVSNDFTGRVIGVVRDFHFQSLREAIEPMILFINPNYASGYRYLSLEISPVDVSGTLAFLKNKFTQASSETPFAYSFLDDDFGRQYETEEKMVEIYGYISLLAILIACLGLFGLSAFSAERRTKEIGVRKVLGATVSGIVGLLSKEFVKLVILASLIAWPLAYYLMSRWLQDFAYRFQLGVGVFLLSGAIALLIALFTVSFQAFKAAVANPVASLRYE